MRQFFIRPHAWREIEEELAYLEETAGIEVAERFLDRLIASFELLGATPRMGASCGFSKPATRRLRRWPVKDFENWLIFYQPRQIGIEVVHILHGARDLDSILDTKG